MAVVGLRHIVDRFLHPFARNPHQSSRARVPWCSYECPSARQRGNGRTRARHRYLVDQTHWRTGELQPGDVEWRALHGTIAKKQEMAGWHVDRERAAFDNDLPCASRQ